MAVFRHPAFAKLSAKIDRAEKELREIERYWFAHLGAVSAATGVLSLPSRSASATSTMASKMFC